MKACASDYDVLVVGAGFFGLTIAERLATQEHKKVLVIDKRDHIGGNCYSETDKETGIEIHKYGAHLFHTSIDEVWNYIHTFSDFTDYVHHVFTVHNNEVFQMPINLNTINQFFHSNYSSEEAKRVIEEQSKDFTGQPKNLYEQGIGLMGKPLFDAFIKNYTEKQWQTPVELLPSSIIKRIPVRFNNDNRYFNDKYEGLPKEGYNKMFENMVNAGGERIEVKLNCNYFDKTFQDEIKESGIFTVYTGPIDEFFNYKYGELRWRCLRFEKEVLEVDNYQDCSVMNYADLNPPYTRIIEFKHFHPERDYACYKKGSGRTVIVKEYSKAWKRGDEPFYPVRTEEDLKKLERYNQEINEIEDVVFGGRLGEYQYYDMDKTIDSALRLYKKIKTIV